MVKKLIDLSLDCVGRNLDVINRVGQYLAATHKELLIERLAFHDRLTKEYLRHVTYNLFSSNLRRIHLYKCDLVTDEVLKKLRLSKCQLRSLTIHGCDHVTGKIVGEKHCLQS